MTETPKLPQEWPSPPSKETTERVDAARRAARVHFVEVAKLSAAEQERLESVVVGMNQKVAAAFDRLVAPKLRANHPLTADERIAFLTEMTAAVQGADHAVAGLAPQAGAAAQSTAFMAATQMDPDNALRVATFYARYVQGAPLASGAAPGTEGP
jgi:hypothetical protein